MHACTVTWNSFAGCQLLGLSSEKGLLNSIGTVSPNWNIKWCSCAHLFLCLLTRHHHSHMLTNCHHKMQPCWVPMTWQCLLVHPCDLLFGITPEYSMAQAEKCSAKKKCLQYTGGCCQLMSLSKVFPRFFLYASSLMPFDFCKHRLAGLTFVFAKNISKLMVWREQERN